MPTPTVLDHARVLSSGTIAKLIGSSRYEDIDLAHGRFITWLQEQPVIYDTWMDAWDMFKKTQQHGVYRFFSNRCVECKAEHHDACDLVDASGITCDCHCIHTP